MRELSLHLLDIAQNSIAAGASKIEVSVIEDTRTDLLQMSVQDNGKGMDAGMASRVTDPFVTSRTTRKVGLGIPLLKEAAEACNGFLHIDSALGKGTLLTVQFQRSHIDRMPLGDVAETFLNLLVANPNIHWIFRYRFDEKEFLLDDTEIKETLQGMPMTEPPILSYLHEMVETGIREITDQYSG